MSTNINRAYQKLIFALSVILLGGFVYLPLMQAQAQTSAEEDAGVAPPEQIAQSDQTNNTEVFTCSAYYSKDSINLQIVPQGEVVSGGTPLNFSGEVENKNSYPIVAGQVWVRVYQVEDADNIEKRTRTNQVTTFLALDNVTISAFAKTPLSFSWTAPALLAAGTYDATYYFVSSKNFYHDGLSYLDEAEGSYSTFKVTGGDSQSVYFDRGSIKLNNQPYGFEQKHPKFFGREEIVYVQAEVVNPAAEEKIVEVIWKTKNWGGEKPDAREVVDRQVLILKPGVKYSVSHMPLHLGGAVTLVEAEVKDGDNSSLFQVWFARNDVEDARITFASVTDYPLAGDKATNKDNQIFACVEGVPGLVASELNLNLRLLDKKGREVLSENKPINLQAGPGGAVANFTTKGPGGNFTLEATLSQGEKVFDRVEVKYDCTVLDKENCREGFVLPDKLPFVAVIVGLLGLLLLVRFYLEKKNHIIAE